MVDAKDIDRAFTPGAERGVGGEHTFAGALSFMRRLYTKDLSGVDLAVTAVPYDLAVTNRPGTRFGPRAIRAASAQIAWHGGSWPWGFDPFESLNVVDYGDCHFDFGTPEEIASVIEAHATNLIEAGVSVLSLGGDHFIAYPLIKAHQKAYGPLALVQFDAHSDTWREDRKRIDHGTMFFHAIEEGVIDAERSVQIGIRTGNNESHGVTIVDADWVHENGPGAVIKRVKDIVGDGRAYLSFDIDCLDPAFAPGTGTPVCGGLSSWQARKILRGLAGIDFVGMDLVEVSPSYDQSEVTALAAATIALDYICIKAARKRSTERKAR